MKRLFEDLTTRLSAFVAQKNTFMLLVQCRDEDCAIVLKTLETQGETSSDTYWVFHQDFIDPDSYIASITEECKKRVELFAKEAEESGEPSWPPLPPEITQPWTQPIERLQRLFAYARDRAPSNVVVVLCPLKIVLPLHWRVVMRDLTWFDVAAPWCHHMRVVVRESSATRMSAFPPEIQAGLEPATFPSTEIYAVDFSPETLHKAMQAEMLDPNVPVPVRMQYLLIDANLDYVHKRYDVAAKKYRLLRDYYKATNNPALLAVTLNGFGEAVATFPNLRDHAIKHFEQAVAAAVQAKSLPLVLHAVMSLGHLYFAHKQWAQAAECYDAAESIAMMLFNASATLLCMEKRGECHYQLEEWGPAQKAWKDGMEIARSAKDDGARRRLLTRLRDMYKEARMRDHVNVAEEELRSLS
jgi:hypothetical protein